MARKIIIKTRKNSNKPKKTITHTKLEGVKIDKGPINPKIPRKELTKSRKRAIRKKRKA